MCCPSFKSEAGLGETPARRISAVGSLHIGGRVYCDARAVTLLETFRSDEVANGSPQRRQLSTDHARQKLEGRAE